MYSINLNWLVSVSYFFNGKVEHFKINIYILEKSIFNFLQLVLLRTIFYMNNTKNENCIFVVKNVIHKRMLNELDRSKMLCLTKIQ